jgi:hypothetical protein
MGKAEVGTDDVGRRRLPASYCDCGVIQLQSQLRQPSLEHIALLCLRLNSLQRQQQHCHNDISA